MIEVLMRHFDAEVFNAVAPEGDDPAEKFASHHYFLSPWLKDSHG